MLVVLPDVLFIIAYHLENKPSIIIIIIIYLESRYKENTIQNVCNAYFEFDQETHETRLIYYYVTANIG